MKNQLEQLQEKFNKIQFIKSYPILNKLTSITLSHKQLIELILSYQFNDKDFHLSYKDIADILCIKYQSVKDMVTKLKKLGYLITNNTKNYNGTNGGSSTSIKVDIDKIIHEINNPLEIIIPQQIAKEDMKDEYPEIIENEDDVIEMLDEDDNQIKQNNITLLMNRPPAKELTKKDELIKNANKLQIPPLYQVKIRNKIIDGTISTDDELVSEYEYQLNEYNNKINSLK